MEDIFNHISSSIPNAVPSFVRKQYDADCHNLLQLIEQRFKNVEISLMLTSVDKYLQYTVGENCHIDLQLIETLIPIARKLWFISMYNIVVEFNKNSNVLYEDAPELEIIGLFDIKLTLKLRIRSLKLLNTILDAFVHYIPSLWEKGSLEKLEYFNEKLDFIELQVILKSFEDYFGLYYTNRIAVSYTKRRSWITSVVRLSSMMRKIWINRRDIGEYLISYLFDKNRLEFINSFHLQSNQNTKTDVSLQRPVKIDLEKETERCEIFYKFRMLLLLCPNSTIYDQLVNGNLFKWLEIVNGEIVSSWNPMFMTFFFRAAKYGWANGTCLCHHFKERIPVIFNILYNSFNLPNKPKATRYRETMPGEYTCLLNKSLKIYKKASKFLVLILHPSDGLSTCDPTQSPKLTNNHSNDQLPLCNNKESLTNGFSKILIIEDLVGKGADTFDYINRLINALYPYTHPSNSGKWSQNISLFVNYLIVAYSRRIIRERSMISAVYNRKFVCLDKSDCCDNTIETHDRDRSFDNEELRSMDFRMCSMIFGVSLQGMFSKNIQICNNYEETIKRICYICPEDFLVTTVDKIMECCNVVNEPNQLLGSLRLFTHLTPLIVKYLPNVVTEILQILLSFISLSEPFITTQSLILISLLLSYIDTNPSEKSRFKFKRPLNNVVVERFLEKRQNYLMANENKDFELQMCLRCLLKRNIFTCNIDKEINLKEIKDKLLNNNYNYMDLMIFIENYCLCDLEEDGAFDPKDKSNANRNDGEDLRKIIERIEETVTSNNKIMEETLNEWSIVYFENILELCSNSSKINLKGSSLMNTVEVSTFLLIRSSLLNLLSKLNHKTLVVIISKLIRFVNDYSYKLDIVKYAISITSCVSYVNPNLLLHQAFSYIQQNLETSFKESISKNEKKNGFKNNGFQKEGDNRLLWYLNCFISVLRYGNVSTLKYKEHVKKIIKLGLSHNSKQLFKLLGKLVYRYCHTLYHVYPLSENSLNQTKLNEKNASSNSSIHQDYLPNNQFLGPIWHVPNSEETSAYQEFMVLLVEEINSLSSLFTSENTDHSCLNGLNCVNGSNKQINQSQKNEVDSDYEITMYNRINRILILFKYLIKSVLLVNLNCHKDDEGRSNDCDFSRFKRSILNLTEGCQESCCDLNEDELVDNFEIRELVEGFVINKVVKIFTYLDDNDLVLDNINEKMTKLISFMVSNDFYTNELSGNNLESLFSSLNRKVTVNTSITSTKPLVKYLSFYHGVNNNSYLQDINEVAYTTMAQDYYYHFINLMKLNPRTNHFNTRKGINNKRPLSLENKVEELEELEIDEEEVVESLSQLSPYKKEKIKVMGRELLDLLIEKMCLNNYKNVSNSSQQILKNIMMIYGNTKYYIINSLLNNLNDLLGGGFLQNKRHKNLSMEVDSENLNGDVAENGLEKENEVMLEQILENIVVFFDSTVLNYIIVNIGLLEKFLVFMMKVISASSNKDLLMSKYDLLFMHYLNLREQPFNSETHQEEIDAVGFNCTENTNNDQHMDENEHSKLNNGLRVTKINHKKHIEGVKRMLKKLGTLVINHWRSRLYYCALLLAYNLQVKEESFFTKFFLEMCQVSTNHYVISVSLQGLMVVLESVNEGVGTLTVPESVSPASSLERELKRKVLNEDLLDQEVLKKVFKSLVYSNHENIINTSNTGTAANSTVTSMGYNMVVNLIKFDRTWPRNRITGNSKSISRHNFSLSYQFFKYIINERGIGGLDFLFEVLNELSETPQSYPENHISFIEMVGGLLKCSLELSVHDNVELWHRLHPILKKELNNIILDRTVDYMDIMRLVLHKIYRLNRNVTLGTDDRLIGSDLCFKYVFNFLLNYEVNPTEYQGENVLLLEINKEDVTGYNLIIIKQLKLFQSLVQEYKHDSLLYIKKFVFEDEVKSEEFVGKILVVLLKNLFDDSQKIRDEISLIISYIMSMTKEENVLTLINDHIQTRFVESETKTNGEEENRRVKGMLNLLNTLYTLAVPQSRLDNSSTHLEFSLKYVSSENIGVAESANKTVVNIVNNFNEYDQEKIFELMGLLIKNVKNNNKVKYISLQLLDTLYKNYCMYVNHFKVVGLLVNSYISLLTDTTIREAAKNNLTTIILTLNDQCYKPLISLFRNFINNYSTKRKELINNISVQENHVNHEDGENMSKEDLVLGVYGFISLISTAPYHIPNWMPNVLVELARCGGSKYPLDVRNVVQKTLQEFFKTHVDAWEQIHANKFTRDQLELLNTYKGCPIYFN